MENAIALYGYLILTFLGFIAPILTILLSLFQEGVDRLAEQYKNEVVQQEDNINKQLKKLSRSKTKSDKTITQIEQNLKKLKELRKRARYKLEYLRPQKQIFRVFTLLILSFLCILVVQFTPSQYIYFIWLLIVMSIVTFVTTIWIGKNLLNIIVEVNKSVSEDKKTREDYIIALLQESSQHEDQYLKEVFLQLNGVTIRDDSQRINIVGEEEQEIKVTIINLDDRMAKQIEVGLRFPYDFILATSQSYSIYKGEDEQILRYTTKYIHGDTNQIESPIKLTALAKGKFHIDTFIKAENIKSVYKKITFIVK